MNWNELKFKYTKTNAIICSYYTDGQWSPLQVVRDDKISINALSASLQYGIQAFEGLKAYRGADEKVRLFRPWENSARLRRSADFLGIASPPESMFIEACKMAVRENIQFLPPYESGATLYLRPFVIGIGGQIDLVSPNEVVFIVAAIPVSSFAGSIEYNSKALIARDHDRTAPMGTGAYKIGGNYAASIVAGVKAKQQGYASVLYLDSGSRRYIDEFSSSNFFGIKGSEYITPESSNILPSITNDSLMKIASKSGLTVTKRAVGLEELDSFDEIGACGTAVVILRMAQIDDPLNGIVYSQKKNKNTANHNNSTCQLLYNKLIGIQFGTEEDTNNWCLTVPIN
ncbi:MAG: branched-chain amino acid aminotransferase [Bacteroidia bacterium]|nr:branched-chain amino acid aminotransferase [Bacteroidia bacterium]